MLKMPAGDGWTRPRRCRAKPSPSTAQIAAAATKLNGAKTPVILLGGGALDAGAGGPADCRKTRLRRSSPPRPAKAPCAPIIRSASAIAWRSPPVQSMLQTAIAMLCVGTELSETDFWDIQMSSSTKT